MEVADYGGHVDSVVGVDAVRRPDQDFLAHVQGDEVVEPICRHGVEEETCLPRAARPEFDESAATGALYDLVPVPGKYAAFGAGEVILRQLGDGFEEGTAALVVKPYRWKGLRSRCEANAGIALERLLPCRRDEVTLA